MRNFCWHKWRVGSAASNKKSSQQLVPSLGDRVTTTTTINQKKRKRKEKKRIPWFCKRAGANNNKKSNPSKSKSSQNATKESRSTSLRITHKNEWSMRESKPNSGWPMWCQGSKQRTRSKLRWRRDEREQRRFKDQHFSHRQECDDGVKLNGMLQYAYSLRLR